MKGKLRKSIRFFAGTCFATSLVLMSAIFYFQVSMPDNFYIYKNEHLVIQNNPFVNAVKPSNTNNIASVNRSNVPNNDVELKLLGIIPIKPIKGIVVDKQSVVPGGSPFGIKLFTEGVIVVDISNIETLDGLKNPAHDSDIKKGDIILSINDVKVKTNEQIAKIFSNSNGSSLKIQIVRDNQQMERLFTPVLSSNGDSYKGGLWVRDSSAGIGTVTYFDESTGIFAGLGHGIADVDTGNIMPLAKGEICDVKINSILKGQSGAPGELRGSFSSNIPRGKLLLNNESGIFGTMYNRPTTYPSMNVKLKQNIKVGNAQIITTIDNTGPQIYSIHIDSVNLNPKNMTKNMMITITDEKLIEKTGGIVQGMSGSPIIQDGELVGAVSHVFVNNSQKGYGIFAEHMTNFSNSLANIS